VWAARFEWTRCRLTSSVHDIAALCNYLFQPEELIRLLASAQLGRELIRRRNEQRTVVVK